MDKNEVSRFEAINRFVHHVQERPVLQKLFANLEERTKAYAEIDKRGERIPYP